MHGAEWQCASKTRARGRLVGINMDLNDAGKLREIHKENFQKDTELIKYL